MDNAFDTMKNKTNNFTAKVGNGNNITNDIPASSTNAPYTPPSYHTAPRGNLFPDATYTSLNRNEYIPS